jgi:hypothetical protein
MEALVYYSRNGKKPPFEVTIELDGQLTYINCNCPLGVERKICRHKINAIRGDKQHSSELTPDVVIRRLRHLFGPHTRLRQHLETEWGFLRVYAIQYPDKEDDISNKRRILGEAFADGFLNGDPEENQGSFDSEGWEESRQVYAGGLDCRVTLTYEDQGSVITSREVRVNEIFISNMRFYLLGCCFLRNENRTFRVDRVREIAFDKECPSKHKSTILEVYLQRRPAR